MTEKSFYLKDWKIEPAINVISKGQVNKKVEPQVMNVLMTLVEHQGEVVSKDHLAKTVWKEVVITENVITRAISSLRKALEDDPGNPVFIQTISKSGYRLIVAKKADSQIKVQDSFTIRLKRKPVLWTGAIAVLVALGAFAIRQTFRPQAVKNEYHPQALANMSNAEYWPAISPDGKFVAYAWRGNKDDNWDIYAKLIGTVTIIRITDEETTELRPRWSQDGNFIYYIRYESGNSAIYKKPVIGGQEIRVASAPVNSFGDFDISPDGEWISFNHRPDKEYPLGIQLIGLKDGTIRTLTSPDDEFNGDIHPRFSPNGNQLAFIRERNPSSMFLYTYNLLTDELKKVTTDPISINGFDWLNEGQLVYASDLSGMYKLWELNLSNGETMVVKAGDNQLVMPRISETGRIVYARMTDDVNLWQYDLHSQVASPWLRSNVLELNGVFSPSTDRVCYTKIHEGAYQIWVADANRQQTVPVSSFEGQYLSSPRWSMDGQWIYFQGFVNGQSDIYRINAKGGIPQNLTVTVLDENTPYISPSGDLYYSKKEAGIWNIWKTDQEGNRPQLVAENAYAPQLSTDENKLFFVRKDTLGLWQKDLSEGEVSLLLPYFHPMFWGAYAVTQQGVYHLNAKDKQFEFYDFTSKESALIYKPLKRIPRLGISLSVSASGDQLLFSQIDRHDSDIMLLEEASETPQ
ncbi:MAG: winged helix-turn-helix domain-containing protein [Cytophagales bacterium]|nr:winged helix-turn-helix domain-containing protein [Cytophagales bacterium]